MRWLLFIWTLACLSCCGCVAGTGAIPAPPAVPTGQAVEKVGGPEPVYWFRLRGLSEEEFAKLKVAEGVRWSEQMEGGWVRFAWYHHDAGGKLLQTAGLNLAPLLMISRDTGRATHHRSSYGATRPYHVASGDHVAFFAEYNDPVAKCMNTVFLYCFADAAPGQVEHEILRGFPGLNPQVSRVDKGYAVFLTTPLGNKSASWMTSEQMVVIVQYAQNKEILESYMQRFPSITSKDIDLSVDKWVENEVRWRIIALDNLYLRRRAKALGESIVWYVDYIWRDTFPTFPREGEEHLSKTSTLLQEWEYLRFVRHWLWANRLNFRYDPERLGYVLKGPDLYDPKNPPELPEDLRGPPKPEPGKEPAAADKPK